MLWVFSFAIVLGGCSGSNSIDGGSIDNMFRYNLGTSARYHIVGTAQEAILNRYGYRLNQEVNTAEDIRIETSWKDVSPFPDELASGYNMTRARIFLSARPRNRSAGTASTFTARIEFEIEARLQMGGDWQQISITAEREAYFKEIAEYLENEFKAGVM